MTGNDRWIRALIILCVLLLAAGLLFAVWLIGSAFSDIVLLFFLAWVLALTIEPSAGVIVKYLRIPLPVAVSLSFLGVLLLIVVGALVVTPLLVAQVIQIIQYLPVLAAELNLRLLALYAELEARGVHVDLESAVGTYDVAGRLQAVIPIILSNILGAASSIANVFVQGGLMIIISYYFALDGRRLAEQFISTLPEQYRDDASYLMESMRTAFFGFLKGNTIMAATYAFGTAGIMLVAGLPYVLLTSILAGICAVIPVIGAMLAVAIVLIIVAIAQSASGIFVLIATIILQQIVYNLVGPRAMKQTIGIHPLLMFVAILVGARLAGAWGAFFGIPIAAAGLSMIRFYRVEKANRPSISNLDGAGSTAGRAPLEAATNAPIETTRA